MADTTDWVRWDYFRRLVRSGTDEEVALHMADHLFDDAAHCAEEGDRP